jgi:hypothetical protein
VGTNTSRESSCSGRLLGSASHWGTQLFIYFKSTIYIVLERSPLAEYNQGKLQITATTQTPRAPPHAHTSVSVYIPAPPEFKTEDQAEGVEINGDSTHLIPEGSPFPGHKHNTASRGASKPASTRRGSYALRDQVSLSGIPLAQKHGGEQTQCRVIVQKNYEWGSRLTRKRHFFRLYLGHMRTTWSRV